MNGKELADKVKLPFGPPPIWPDIKDELRNYIECPEKLPIHQLDNAQCYWPREPDVFSLLNYELAPLGTTLKFDRDPITGRIGKMHEVLVKGAGDTARNSMAMTRAPSATNDEVRGNPSNILFWPGGFDESELKDVVTDKIDFEKNLRTLAKGFSSGIEFESDNYTPKRAKGKDKGEIESLDKETQETEVDKVNLMAIVHEEENMLGLWSSDASTSDSAHDSDTNLQLPENVPDFLEDVEVPVLKISEARPEVDPSEWAEQVDVSVPVLDFEKRIPDPALTFEYELDTFQKQAIIKLEENCNVFIAAHTSAGKTTVAEYAIALSQKHMTRVIYTSPIKALSNQKYRDFKKKFESVGLLTGDLQINQTASCLIMTTEILQSMLYCASEVLRDLEFVIFDEVHYINNEDRGHVWEEIVILLPHSVNIVMLSATVPKPIIFANWVGSIKKRKTYVISTFKRPVPLQHYLYTGTSAKTKSNMYLVLDATNVFLLDKWLEACKSKEAQDSKDGKDTRRRTHMTPKQEETLWMAFIKHLKSNDMLPVVVFTLSRKRCDMNAILLRNINLTTGSEKFQVRNFFENSVKHLKGTDKELPQVVMMKELLEQGVGIHHSGILPILKEIVEMLFQSGFVKLLFATETFAMGVNMPARTVVFDSIRKFDGVDFRTLYPTEYIQMAGRAGRRGHDTTGNVIIMCRNEVPHFNSLKEMMCGQPQTLESRFKITYSMVLNLRRVVLNETVTVEAMMRRSFKESSRGSNQVKYQTELGKIEQDLAELPLLSDTHKKFSKFYEVALDYFEEYKYLKPHMLEAKKASKSLTEGRILLVSYGSHYRKLGLLLSAAEHDRSTSQYKVLVLKNGEIQYSHDRASSQELDNSKSCQTPDKSERWYEMVSLSIDKIFVPNGVPSHEVLNISPWNILEVTNCQIKVDCSMVLNDWEKRQIARFRNDVPGQTCRTAIQELYSMSLDAAANPKILLPYGRFKLSHNLIPRLQHLKELMKHIRTMKCTEIPNFEEQFEPVFERCELESKRRQLQLKLSDEGLALYPEYLNMVALLKELGYIDNDERVALKGRVALHMGSNALLITELILKNVLTMLRPAEIAALLSALIFQQRQDEKITLPPELQNGCDVMLQVYDELNKLEQYYNLYTLQPLNFGLVEVVYEWAQAKSFAEIMKKTAVQEGIIVRCIQQLSETLHDVRNAAITIGDPILKEKMEEASTVIKRDIVFAASLYTQD